MYYLSVGACFKNEAHCIVEWLEHYLLHGVEHFYLVNDGSTDNTVEKLHPYIEKGIITLFTESNHPYYQGRQRNLYNKHILPRINNKETTWCIMLDLDEFLWSEKEVDLRRIFAQLHHLGQVQFTVTLFGSNGHVQQPESLIEAFTKRSKDLITPNPKCLKYAVHSRFKFSSLNVHHADFWTKEEETNHFQHIKEPWFRLNHYSCQSREFWDLTKCKRGDADHWYQRGPEHFVNYDYNEIEDLGLLEQNRIERQKTAL